MTPEEFKRRLEELEKVICDAVAYFHAWRGLVVEDEDSVQSLNRYKGFFRSAHNALLWMTIMQLAKAFDHDTRTISLRNLLNLAKQDPSNLVPHMGAEAIQVMEKGIDDNEALLERLKAFRDQRLAHHDSVPTKEMSLQFRDVEELVTEVQSMYNNLRRGHDRVLVAFDAIARDAERDVVGVVNLMREDMARFLNRLNENQGR